MSESARPIGNNHPGISLSDGSAATSDTIFVTLLGGNKTTNNQLNNESSADHRVRLANSFQYNPTGVLTGDLEEDHDSPEYYIEPNTYIPILDGFIEVMCAALKDTNIKVPESNEQAGRTLLNSLISILAKYNLSKFILKKQSTIVPPLEAFIKGRNKITKDQTDGLEEAIVLARQTIMRNNDAY